MSTAAGSTNRLGADLRVRVISAIVMLVVALGATLLGGWAFAVLVAVGGVALCYEWSLMTRKGDALDTAFWVSATGVVLIVLAVMIDPPRVLGVPVWVLIAAIAPLLILLRSARDANLATIGYDYVLLPVVAILWFRNEPEYGLLATLFLFVVVWGTDIMAYVFGRFLGGPKLWPAVSPKKTWSGALGGTAGAVLGGIVIASQIPGASLGRIAVIAALLSIISQIGDLVESAIKRKNDVKDSSNLLPGHGGVFDRVDGLLFAVAAAGLYVWLVGPLSTPARTLLLGPFA